MGMGQMELPDGTILMHGRAPYDPVKAHQYYLRTRELKGRKKGSNAFTVKLPSGKTTTLTARQLTEQRVYAAKRVNDIKLKLVELGNKLKQAMSEARQQEAKSAREARKPETAAEKSKAAREAKQYRAKNQQKLATKRKAAAKTKTVPKKDSVAQLQTKINDIKKRLSTAVSIQRALAGATKKS
jgi:hypothetical protein